MCKTGKFGCVTAQVASEVANGAASSGDGIRSQTMANDDKRRQTKANDNNNGKQRETTANKGKQWQTKYQQMTATAS